MRTVTVLLVGALALPGLAAAQGQGRRHARRTTISAGEVALPLNPARASADVERFQQALRAEGCDPGPIDGIIGPRTGQAIACARRKGVVPSAPGASFDTTAATNFAHDVFPPATSPVVGEAAGAPTPPAAASIQPVVTGIPVPTVNAAHDSIMTGRNSARDSTLSGGAVGTPTRGRTPPVRPDTAHR